MASQHPLSQTQRILMIDDSAFDRCLVADLLMDQDYELLIAHDAEQGYSAAVTQLPDLILLDVSMPGQDGYACCRMLKQNPVTRDIPVIFLSGKTEPGDRIQGLKVGAVDFVSKPYHNGELQARIRIHLALVHRPKAPARAAAANLDMDEVVVTAAKLYIEQHLARNPSLDDIADAVGTNRGKLNETFRQRTGLTVFSFIRERRIERGQQLLRETKLGITDIAGQIGFNSAGNFATAFRERLGLTPSAFRLSLQ